MNLIKQWMDFLSRKTSSDFQSDAMKYMNQGTPKIKSPANSSLPIVQQTQALNAQMRASKKGLYPYAPELAEVDAEYIDILPDPNLVNGTTLCLMPNAPLPTNYLGQVLRAKC